MSGPIEPPSATSQTHRLGRDWSLYTRTAICIYLVDGYAPAAILLGVERGLSNLSVGLYSAAMGLGILLGGVATARPPAALTRENESWLAILAASIGIGILTGGPGLTTTLLGMVIIGVSAAAALSTVQSLIADQDGPRGLSESSGFGELFGMLAPFVVALSANVGLTWRGGLLIIPIVAATAYLARNGRPAVQRIKTARSPIAAVPYPASHRFSSRSWIAWLCGTLLSSAEFTTVLWLPDLLQLNVHFRPATATALVSVLLAGMAAGRLLAGRLPLNGNLDRILEASVMLALGAFMALWLSSSGVVAVIAVVLMGVGMSAHYPIALARLIASTGGAAQQASARTAAGLGLAMLTCPPLLGALSEFYGLRWATLIIPAILLAAWTAIRGAPAELP